MSATRSLVIPLLLLGTGSLGLHSNTSYASASRPMQRTIAQSPHGSPSKSSTGSSGAASWAMRDTTLYVVSTINLLSPLSPDALTQQIRHTLHVTRYAVYADTQRNDLYFIRLQRHNGSTASALVYQLGWKAPMAITPLPKFLRASTAPSSIVAEYVTGYLRFVGAVHSLMPS